MTALGFAKTLANFEIDDLAVPLLADFQRFQRGRQCYLFLIVVFGDCQLPESQADLLLCGANLTLQQFRTSFSHCL